MSASFNWDIGWEAMVVLVVFLLVLGFVCIVLLIREKRSHKTRVGFFIERERFEFEEPEELGPDEQPTAEWPIQKQ